MTRINDVGSEVKINKAIDAIGFEHNFDEIDEKDRTNVAGEDMGYIMTILSKLYDRPQFSAFREYLSNAVDANIIAARETGASRPAVEVTFPETNTSALLIRDFGLGLDRDGMVRAFARYGASDKRDDNTTTGGFGLGSKSALAFSAHFKIASTSLVDGEYVTEFAIMTPPGIKFAGSRKGVFDETGTVVEIPADSFEWEAGISNILDNELFAGTPNNHIRFRVGSEGNWIDYKGREALTIGEPWLISEIPGAYIQVRSEATNNINAINLFVSGINYAVANSLPYAVKEIVKYLNVYLPPGTVSFTPARDSIQYDDITKNILGIVTEYLATMTASNVFSTVADAKATMKERYAATHTLMNKSHKEAVMTDAMMPGQLPVMTNSQEGVFFCSPAVTTSATPRHAYNGRSSVNFTDNYDSLFFIIYDPATLELNNAKYGMTDKIATNRLAKLSKGMESGLYKKVSKLTHNDWVVVVPITQASDFVKNFNPARVESFNTIFDKMSEIDKKVLASKKNVSASSVIAGKKISVSHLNKNHDKDINQVVVLSDLQQPTYKDRVVGWYYGNEATMHVTSKALSGDFDRLPMTLSQSGLQGNLIEHYLGVKEPIAIKLRKGADAKKTLDEIGFSHLSHLNEVYTSAINSLVSELTTINKALEKNPDALALANTLGGVKNTMTKTLVNAFFNDFQVYGKSLTAAKKKSLVTTKVDSFIDAVNGLEKIVLVDHHALLTVIQNSQNRYYNNSAMQNQLVLSINEYFKDKVAVKGLIEELSQLSPVYIQATKNINGSRYYQPSVHFGEAFLPSLMDAALIKDLLGK